MIADSWNYRYVSLRYRSIRENSNRLLRILPYSLSLYINLSIFICLQYPTTQRRVGQLADEPMVPFYPPEYNIHYFKYAADFGYSYDTLCLAHEGILLLILLQLLLSLLTIREP